MSPRCEAKCILAIEGRKSKGNSCYDNLHDDDYTLSLIPQILGKEIDQLLILDPEWNL